MDLVSTVLVGAFSGAVSTMLTLIVSPRLQHHFWTRQRHAELSLSTLQEINKLSAHFLAYLRDPKEHPIEAHFSDEWSLWLGQARALFSEDTGKVLDRLDEQVGQFFLNPFLDKDRQVPDDKVADNFHKIRDEAIVAVLVELEIRRPAKKLRGTCGAGTRRV
jgi:hypothetical protein